jgi:predicted RNA-binding Zn-ribbon protein involved in translation (DUF1610 family)
MPSWPTSATTVYQLERRHDQDTGRCAGCGNTGPLAEGRVFSRSLGLVLRCPACGAAFLRLARTYKS